MLSPDTATIRLFIHVLAATVWVGGQIVLAGIVPSLRKLHPEATTTVARAFARIAWTSFFVLVVSGIWNLMSIDIGNAPDEYWTSVAVHVGLTATAGTAAAVHSMGRSKVALALGGSIGLLTSLSTLFVGILLRSGS